MKRLLLLLLLCQPAFAAVPTLDATPNIATDYHGWLTWMWDRVDEFETAHPSARTTTYYVDATTGDDGDTGLTEALAFQTWAHAYSVAEASAGDVRIRLKRGEEWIEAVNATITKNNITVDAYGTGPRPKLSHFTEQYADAADPWTQVSGNQWSLSETDDIAWVRFKHDPYGNKRGYVLEEEDSEANCLANDYSFFYDATGDELFINLGGENPNAWDIEAVVSNADNGIWVQGDGCRIEDILTDGFGIHRTTQATDAAGVFVRVVDTESCYVKGCGSYYGPNHVMQANGSSVGNGGSTVWIGCDSGFCHSFESVPTESNLVAFNGQGGQEAWFINCPFRFGALPGPTWDYASLRAGGIGTICHTGGGYENTIPMAVIFNCDICDAHTPMQRVGGPSDAFVVSDGDRDDFTAYTGFIVNCDVPIRTKALALSANVAFSTGTYNIMYGGRVNMHRLSSPSNPQLTGGIEGHSWMINTVVIDDFTTVGASSTFHAFYNSSEASPNNRLHMLNCQYLLTNIGSLSSNRFSLDADARTNSADTSANALTINTIYAFDTASKGYLTRTNAANRLFNNAFYQVTDDAGNIRGYNLGTANIALSSFPTFGTSQAAMLQAGYTGNAAYDLSHDINGKPRLVSTPDVGPIDYSSTLLGE